MIVLFVCSGNTCRSPLAVALMRRHLAAIPALRDVTVVSAGTSAWDGAPASEGSYLVALEMGLDLSDHRARMLTPDLVRRSDVILTMTEAHAHRVADLGGAARVHPLMSYAGENNSQRDVPDPFGGDVTVYREVAGKLDVLIERAVKRLARGNAS